MDEAIVAGVAIAFATLVTAHVALVAGLVARGLRLHALLAIAVPPLAPWWGARTGMRWRTGAWALGALGYLALRLAARA